MNIMNDQIVRDVNAIKREISDNSRLFIQSLIKSLKLKKHQPFSHYKIDLSLFYLKQLYERNFPQKKHGANLLSNRDKMHIKKSREETDRVTESVTFRNGISLLNRTIIINLLEGVKYRDQVPSFVKLVSNRSFLSRSTIQNRIRVGQWLTNDTILSDVILQYRKGLISHSQVLRQVNKCGNNIYE
jgi:hypothetical protein